MTAINEILSLAVIAFVEKSDKDAVIFFFHKQSYFLRGTQCSSICMDALWMMWSGSSIT